MNQAQVTTQFTYTPYFPLTTDNSIHLHPYFPLTTDNPIHSHPTTSHYCCDDIVDHIQSKIRNLGLLHIQKEVQFPCLLFSF